MNILLKNVSGVLEGNFNYLSQIFSKSPNCFRFLSHDGMRIFFSKEISSDFVKSLNSFLEISFSNKNSLLKLTKTRSVATGTLPQSNSNDKKIFIKKYIVKSRLKGIVNLISPSKAWREMYVGMKLINCGIPTAKPLLVGEKISNSQLKESYFITEEIPDAQPFISFIKQESFQKEKKEVLFKLANFVSWVHSKGLWHPDLSPKNILVSNINGNDLKLFVLDVDGGIFLKNISIWKRAKNLTQLFRHVGHFFTEEDKTFLIDSYCNVSNSIPADKLWKYLQKVKFYSILKDKQKSFEKAFFKKKKSNFWQKD